MKKLYRIISLSLAVSAITGCSDLKFGNALLDQQPEKQGADIKDMFSSQTTSETVLAKVYSCLPYGLFLNNQGTSRNKLGNTVLENITDLSQSFVESNSNGARNLYYNGALSANVGSAVQGSEAYRWGDEVDWTAIRYGWTYITHINEVPDMTEDEKNERAAEAKTVIAASYIDMLRNVGGVCWIDHEIDISETMQFPRLTFEESVNKIVALLDEAIPHLPWKWDESNDGRMNKAGAIGLKLRLLLFAASPTFNSDQPYHPAADTYTCYGNYEKARWEAAKAAGEAFYTEWKANGEYGLTQPVDKNSMQDKREAYRSAYYDRGGTEVLVSSRMGYGEDIHSLYLSQRFYSAPTLNYVDMFPWSDGEDFPSDFDWENCSDRDPFWKEEGGVKVEARDPRLYETVAVPGDTYYDGTQAPIYTNHPSYVTGSGFLFMKFVLQNSSQRANRPVQWPILRLSEVMLSYAEALNEVNDGPTAQAYDIIDEIRDRAGLSPINRTMSKDEFKEAVLRERALELGMEEVRWYDLVRHGRKADFTKTLYGLSSRGDKATAPTSFTYKKIELSKRSWCDNWDTKWYLSPIPVTELNKNYGMTQNPGW